MQTARKNVNADTAMATDRYSFTAKPTANGKLKAAAIPMKNPESRAFPYKPHTRGMHPRKPRRSASEFPKLPPGP